MDQVVCFYVPETISSDPENNNRYGFIGMSSGAILFLDLQKHTISPFRIQPVT